MPRPSSGVFRRRLIAVLAAGSLAACVPKTPPPGPEPSAAPPVEVPPEVGQKPSIDPGAPPEPEVPPDTTPPELPPRPVFRAALPVRLALTGDINLGSTTIKNGVPPDSGRAFLAGVDSLLVGDLVVGNFESVLADSGTSTKCGPPLPDSLATDLTAAPKRVRRGSTASRRRPNCYAFATPSYLAPRLVEAGFTHLNLANNHANDFGPAAREQTQQTLAGLGLRYYGPLGHISIDTLRHGDSITVVGLLGFTTYPFAYDLLDLERSAVVVDSVKHLVDVLVVTFHGGAEGAAAVRTGSGPEFLGKEPRGNLRLWSRRVIEAGADLVVGHGPHVLRGVEFYEGRPIFYSLGNFATYRGFKLAGPLGVTAVLQVELGGDGSYRWGRMVPLIQRPRTGPQPDPNRAAIALLRRITRLDFAAGGAQITRDGTIRPPAPAQ